VVTALYRRYRPETFAEMIGQSQVTDPLMTALRTNRVNHAYLFSGPRGCGKTTSARILARCLNCAEGPTDTPCGVCPSCVELSRDGSGSLDVVEIDAASHNGVDDARDIRERAIFAPARDRYKIFILDEAHMVTPQGFNALLKIVEEPPEHVKFIFATTEPEKVIGTIRSRTHHYPFRLVPPAQMLEYVQKMCDLEAMKVAPGVLPLVVRAGGGSPRDTLSLLDQLMAGSDTDSIEYERAVALLGYTHASLLDEAIDAIAARDSASAFDAVDRVIQTGQDPRRFVEDLLERMRDLIVVAATSAAGAAAVLRGVPQDELDRMAVQAAKFGPAELSRTADILNAALTEMSGATSPRLHLELMVARALIPASDDTARGALARVERLERRIGVDGPDAAVSVAASSPARPPASSAAAPAARPATASGGDRPAAGAGSAGAGAGAGLAGASGTASGTPPGAAAAPVARTGAGGHNNAPESPVSGDSSAQRPGSGRPGTAATPTATPPAPAAAPAATPTPIGPITLHQVKDAWPEVLEAVKAAKLSAWLVVFTARVLELRDGDVLVMSFPSEADVASFKQKQAPGQGVSDYLRAAIVSVLGLRVKFVARGDTDAPAAPDSAPTRKAAPASAPAPVPTSAPTPSPAPAPAMGGASGPDAAVPAASASTAPSAPSSALTASSASATGAATTAPASVPVFSSPAPASATGWATVAIPGSAPDPEPPFDEEPPPFDDDIPPESDFPADRPPAAAPAPAREPAARSTATQSSAAKAAATDAAGWATAPPASASSSGPASATSAARASAVSAPAAATRAASGAPAPAPSPSPSTAAGTSGASAAAPDASAAQRPAAAEVQPSAAQAPAAKRPARASAPSFAEKQRYGESVVREILGATFLEEQAHEPAVRPRND
jgi:DNA polymerase-3 subunit gamma/tau